MSALRPPPPGYRISTRPLPYWRYVHETPRDMSAYSFRPGAGTAGDFIPDYTPSEREYMAAFWTLATRGHEGVFGRILREGKTTTEKPSYRVKAGREVVA